MITFDQNGIATPESQAFFENQRLQIIQSDRMSDSKKTAKLSDLYNQYGMEFGTFKRKGHQEVTAVVETTSDTKDSKTTFNMKILFWLGVLFMLLWAIGAADTWFVKEGINFSFAKEIERFFQWVFGG